MNLGVYVQLGDVKPTLHLFNTLEQAKTYAMENGDDDIDICELELPLIEDQIAFNEIGELAVLTTTTTTGA